MKYSIDTEQANIGFRRKETPAFPPATDNYAPASTEAQQRKTVALTPANDNDLQPALRLVRAPAGLSRSEAAAYIGVSPVAFDALIASGLMPPALPLGIRRRIWNVRALDLALDKLAGIERSIQPAVVMAGQEARTKLLEMLGDDQD